EEILFEGVQNIDETCLIRNLLQPGMVFFDIGSNQGEYSIIAAGLVESAGQVFAFEPVPAIYEMLESNISLNHLKTVITTNKIALGDTESLTEMYAALGRNNGLSSLKPLNVSCTVETEKIKVPVTSLDAFVAKYQIPRLDVAKIDVEGGELSVIQGGKAVWKGLRPIVIAEVQDKRTAPWGYKASEIVRSLSSHNYRWFEFAEGGKLRPHAERPFYEYCNLVAVPPEKVSGLAHLIATPLE